MLLRLRKTHSLFRRTNFFRGILQQDVGVKDITWLSNTGGEMLAEEWTAPFARCLGFHLGGLPPAQAPEEEAEASDSEAGDEGDHFIILMNAHDGPIPFKLPPPQMGERWSRVFDTARPEAPSGSDIFTATSEYPLEARSFALLVCDRRQTDRSGRTRRVAEMAPVTAPPKRRPRADAVPRVVRARPRTSQAKRTRPWTKTKP